MSRLWDKTIYMISMYFDAFNLMVSSEFWLNVRISEKWGTLGSLILQIKKIERSLFKNFIKYIFLLTLLSRKFDSFWDICGKRMVSLLPIVPQFSKFWTVSDLSVAIYQKRIVWKQSHDFFLFCKSIYKASFLGLTKENYSKTYERKKIMGVSFRLQKNVRLLLGTLLYLWYQRKVIMKLF